MVTRTLTAAALAILVFSACSQVLGLDDYRVVSDSETNNGNTSENCSLASLSPNEQVVRSCVLASSCSPFVQSVSISTCVTINRQAAFTGENCTITATSCDDIDSCRGNGMADSGQCDGQTGVRCQDNIGINCDGNPPYFIDCSVRGGTCEVLTDEAGDSYPSCRVVDTCDATDDLSHCEGNLLYGCTEGKGYGVDCSSFGTVCMEVDGEGSCYYPAPDCTEDVQGCSGNVARYCSSVGDLLAFDCGSVGLACTATESGDLYCVAPGCTPDDVNNCEEGCSGSTLNICYGGVSYPVDCTEYGFSRCATYTSDTLGNYAACTD